MRLFKGDVRGISPIIGIIIMVAITLVIAGIAALWFMGYADNGSDDDSDKIFMFDVRLDGSDDTLTFSVISGEVLNTSRMTIRLDDTLVPVPVEMVNAGLDIRIDAGTDLVIGDLYNVKITVSNKLYYNNDLIAAP